MRAENELLDTIYILEPKGGIPLRVWIDDLFFSYVLDLKFDTYMTGNTMYISLGRGYITCISVSRFA